MKKINCLAFCLFVTVSTVTAAIWDGTANTDWYDASQSEFTISTAEELAGLAELVNGGNDFKDKTITLAADIMLNDTTDWRSWDSTTTGLNAWIPIGKSGQYGNNIVFAGIFNGYEHTISGIYKSYRSNSAPSGLGLFAFTGNESVIKNISVLASYIKANFGEEFGSIVGNNKGLLKNCFSNGSVTGDMSVGGMVGRNNGTVMNCISNNSVNGKSYIGGMVGTNSGIIDSSHSASTLEIGGGIVGYNWGTISNSKFTGTITGEIANGYDSGTGTIGGVAQLNSGIVSNSYSTANIASSTSYPFRGGGVVGFNEDDGIIKNCYSTGTVFGGNSAGGIVGENAGIVMNCYSTGTVISSSYTNGNRNDNYIGGIVGNSTYSDGSVKNCAALNQSITDARFAGRIVGRDLYLDNVLLGNTAFKDMIVNKSIIKGQDKEDGEDITAEAIKADGTIGGRFTEENGWTVENGKLPGLLGQTVDLPEHLGGISPIQKTTNHIHTISILLNGTESFKIQDLAKLEKVRMFSLSGKILLNRQVQPNESVSISHLPHGVYLVNVEGKTLRFVK